MLLKCLPTIPHGSAFCSITKMHKIREASGVFLTTQDLTSHPDELWISNAQRWRVNSREETVEAERGKPWKIVQRGGPWGWSVGGRWWENAKGCQVVLKTNLISHCCRPGFISGVANRNLVVKQETRYQSPWERSSLQCFRQSHSEGSAWLRLNKRLYLEVQAKLVSSFLSRVFISFLIGGWGEPYLFSRRKVYNHLWRDPTSLSVPWSYGDARPLGWQQ